MKTKFETFINENDNTKNINSRHYKIDRYDEDTKFSYTDLREICSNYGYYSGGSKNPHVFDIWWKKNKTKNEGKNDRWQPKEDDSEPIKIGIRNNRIVLHAFNEWLEEKKIIPSNIELFHFIENYIDEVISGQVIEFIRKQELEHERKKIINKNDNI